MSAHHLSLTAALYYNLPMLTPPTLESHNCDSFHCCNDSSISREWEWYLVWVTVSPCMSIYNILCMKVKSKSVSIANWGPSSISAMHHSRASKTPRTKKKNPLHTLINTHAPCTYPLLCIYIHKNTHHSHKLTRPHWQAHTHESTNMHTHTQLHKHPRSLAEKRQKSEWESRHLDEQIMV